MLLARRRRLSRSITAILHSKDLNRDLGYKPRVVGIGGSTFRFATQSGRVFEVWIGVRKRNTLPERITANEVPPGVKQFADNAVLPMYYASVQFDDEEESTDVTGKGEQHEVMGNVAAIMYQFLNANPHVAFISFSGEPKARLKIYDRFARKVSGDHGYLKLSQDEDSAVYVVPNGAYNAQAAQEAAQDPYGNLKSPQDEGPSKTPEEDNQARDEVAWIARDAAMTQDWDNELENTDAEAEWQQESYIEQNEAEMREEFAGEIATSIYTQMMSQEETREREKEIKESALEQAEDQTEDQWEDHWNEHIEGKQWEFHSWARESIEEGYDEWKEIWYERNPLEDFYE